MNVADAEKNFAKLVNKVYAEGISVDLERDDKVIARLTPAEPMSPLTVGALNAFLRNLPSLGDDADAFTQDVRAIRAEFSTARAANRQAGAGGGARC
jgi:antitoxin (DNA-binding transcriptional repressor) of toxin-antitoxin stability system